jgi:hypothetical protein
MNMSTDPIVALVKEFRRADCAFDNAVKENRNTGTQCKVMEIARSRLAKTKPTSIKGAAALLEAAAHDLIYTELDFTRQVLRRVAARIKRGVCDLYVTENLAGSDLTLKLDPEYRDARRMVRSVRAFMATA